MTPGGVGVAVTPPRIQRNTKQFCDICHKSRISLGHSCLIRQGQAYAPRSEAAPLSLRTRGANLRAGRPTKCVTHGPHPSPCLPCPKTTRTLPLNKFFIQVDLLRCPPAVRSHPPYRHSGRCRRMGRAVRQRPSKTDFGYQNGYQACSDHQSEHDRDQRNRWSQKWAVRDSNPRPPARHAGALAN